MHACIVEHYWDYLFRRADQFECLIHSEGYHRIHELVNIFCLYSVGQCVRYYQPSAYPDYLHLINEND